MPADRTATSPRSVKQAARVMRLVALHPPAAARAGLSKVLEGTLQLSRKDGADAARAESTLELLALDDAEVSRRHATLSPLEGGSAWQVEDHASHNGTYVNGTRVAQAALSAGDVLRVGQHVLLLQELDLEASRRLSRRRMQGSRLLGDGPACKWVDEQIAACAAQDAPVLVLGESGTGKDLVAQQLHESSGRGGRFVPVNCTALSETMADSELFGHVQGAFSGAARTRDGLFVAAQGGTLFLDELGDMPLSIQAKLLRTIESGEVRKVGSDRAAHVDSRVVAATHVDLESAVRHGRFRGDLWARLQRLVIRVPALRERRDDVLVLTRHFLQAAGSKLSISADAAEALVLHDWPYNVRELRNAIDTARQRAQGGRAIELEHLPTALGERLATRVAQAPLLPVGRAPRDAAELERVLREHDWNVTKVAALFGRDRKQIYRWCEAFGIDLEARR